jgi:uncharacterized protein with HEPN domain
MAEHLRDIIGAIKAAQELRPATRREFDEDPVSQLAMARLVEIVGEAADQVGPLIQRANPEVPSCRIISMSHRITHGYFEMDLNALWQVLTVDLPSVLPRIEQILAEVDSAAPPEQRGDSRRAEGQDHR